VRVVRVCVCAPACVRVCVFACVRVRGVWVQEQETTSQSIKNTYVKNRQNKKSRKNTGAGDNVPRLAKHRYADSRRSLLLLYLVSFPSIVGLFWHLCAILGIPIVVGLLSFYARSLSFYTRPLLTLWQTSQQRKPSGTCAPCKHPPPLQPPLQSCKPGQFARHKT
jgi:hypothetical protein